MKNLFNNPWFVVALGLFALGYLGYTVGAPLFSQDAQAVGDDTPGLAGPGLSMDATERPGFAPGTGPQADIDWMKETPRDPFALDALPVAAQDSVSLPVLGALFVSSTQQTAVINKRLVQVGDSVDDFLVEHIATDHVRVSRGRESFLLEPES